MLPTPSTSHVDTNRIYEPAEDSYLLLDTLSSTAETEFLRQRFDEQAGHRGLNPSPLVLEVGTGSGIVLAFVAAQAKTIFGRQDIIALGTDVNYFACGAAKQTVQQTSRDANSAERSVTSASPSAILCADLMSPLRCGVADVLIFNPPYVPSPDAPGIRPVISADIASSHNDVTKARPDSFEYDSHLLSLSYAGGLDGMEVTNKFLEDIPSLMSHGRGDAYILFCQQNKPTEVMKHVRSWGKGWEVQVVGRSGKTAGWEKLVVVRIWQD